MGTNYRPLPTKCVVNFLLSKGFELTRISASHHQYTKKGYRTVPIWGNEKDIPAMHLKTTCKTLNITTETLYEWAKHNC